MVVPVGYSLKTFRGKALWSALVILAISIVAALSAAYFTSRSIVRANLNQSLLRRVRLATEYVDAVYAEASRKLELLEKDSYLRSLAVGIMEEEHAYEKARLATDLNRYLLVRYFNQQEFSSLFLISERFVIGNRATSASSTEQIRVLEASARPVTPTSTAEGVLASITDRVSAPAVRGHLHPRQLVTVAMPDDLTLAAVIDFAEALKSFTVPTLITDESSQVIYASNTRERVPVTEISVDPSDESVNLEPIDVSGTHFMAVTLRAAETGLSVTQLFDMTQVHSKQRLALAVSVTVALGLALVWFVVSRLMVDKICAPLSEFNHAVTSSTPTDSDAFARLIHRHRLRPRLRSSMRLFYGSLAIPACITIVVVFVLFQGFITGQRMADYSSIADHEARNLSYRAQTLREYAIMLALDPEIQAALWSLSAERPDRLRQRFSEIAFRKGTLLRDLSHISFRGPDYAPIYPEPNSGPSRRAVFPPAKAFNRHHSLSTVWQLTPDAADTSLTIRVRGLPHPTHRAAFFAPLGFIELRTRNLFRGMDTVSRSGDIKLLVDTEFRSVRRIDGTAALVAEEIVEWALNRSSGREYATVNQSGEAVHAKVTPVEGTNWRLVHVARAADFRSGSQAILLYGAIIVLGLLLLVYTASDLAANRLLEPISRLHTWMESAALEDHDGIATDRVDNEFVQLISGFTGMLARLKELAEDMRAREIQQIELDRRKKEAQLIALQTQMNPHFLYNIFSSVDFLIDLGRYHEASQMLAATGQLFRKGMYRGKLVVPLSEEIAHTKAYLELQRIRHKGEIRTTWEIDDALLGIQVPKFILQPLVENAVEHGIVRGQPLSMRISIRRRGIALRITVEDDGRGIAPEVLSDLRDTLRRGEQSEHLGLVNVNERIHLHHGEPLALRLSSTPGHGCTVSVTVPAPEGADVPKAIEESAVAESRANI